MKYTNLFTLFFIIGIIIISCSYDDETPPEIAISSPTVDLSFMHPDTLILKALVTDNRELSSIQITTELEFNNNITTFDDYMSHDIDLKIPINENLDSGTYSIIITAIDAEYNQSSESIDVVVN